MFVHRLLLVAAVLPAFSAVGAQSAAPPRRAHHALVYDQAGQRVLLTGGSTPLDGGQRFAFFNDLWAFDGTRWSPLPPSGAQMSGVQLAYDAKNKRIVSFGGYAGSSVGDVRVLDQNVWKPLGQHADMPAAEPGFVYDVRRDRFIAFGGSAGRGRAHGDTWQFDGATWTKLATSGPPARQAHVMVYDEKRGRTVVFGGMAVATPGQPPPLLGDTWEFDGTTWTEQKVAGPSPRTGAGATYDAKRGLVILFGGSGASGFSGETWSWDGTAWKKLSDAGPEPRGMGYMAYDRRRDRIVLFGGRKGWPDGDLDDTWQWDGSVWRRSP
jgi:hypothetical protein